MIKLFKSLASGEKMVPCEPYLCQFPKKKRAKADVSAQDRRRKGKERGVSSFGMPRVAPIARPREPSLSLCNNAHSYVQKHKPQHTGLRCVV